MDEAVLEGEAIDERLQRRAGRAHRAGHVDLPGAALVEIIRRADMGEHVAALIVDREDGDRDVRARARRRGRAPALPALSACRHRASAGSSACP